MNKWLEKVQSSLDNRFNREERTMQESEIELVQSTDPYPHLPDHWVWMAVILTAFYTYILYILYDVERVVGPSLIYWIALLALIYFDVKELKRHRLDERKWFALGALSLPIYLFMRAAKTNGHYGPAIIWNCWLQICIFVFLIRSLGSR